MSEARRSILVTATALGTVNAFLVDMLSDLRSQGFDVFVAANCSSTGSASELQSLGFSVVHVPWSSRLFRLSNLRAYWRLTGEFRTGQYTVVETHTPIASAIVRLASVTCRRDRRAAISYFVHGFHFQHHQPSGSARVWLAIEQILARRTDHITVINRDDFDMAINVLGYDRTQILRLNGVGIDTEYFLPSPAPQTEGLPNFAVVGRLVSGKRPLEAVHAIAQLRHKCTVEFAGAGPLEGEIERTAARLGVNATILGRIDDVRPLLLRSKALLFLSEREGLPRSVLEAVSVGLPVVAHRIRGVTDILDGQPWWYEPRSREPADVARALEAALFSHHDAREMRRSIEAFETARVAEMHSGAILDLAERSRL